MCQPDAATDCAVKRTLTVACNDSKAVINRRLRPRCCHLGKVVVLQLVLLRTVYSQAQGCVCAALQLGGDVEQPWLQMSSVPLPDSWHLSTYKSILNLLQDRLTILT